MDPSHSTPSHAHGHHQNPSSSDLMASAKLVAEAAKSTFSHESDKIDRARVAGAASDLLDAACHYGKLEEKSFGKYVEKAEDYLRQYGSSHPSAATAAAGGHHPAPQHAGAPAAAAAAPHHSSAHSGGEEHSGSGGHGDYLKMAQGFLNSGGKEHSGSGGGYGDYMKMAQGFLKK
ncbi:nodulin-related protein 1-like [Rhodamnia argentea]|uniref:Nodulin-related protein 1-like n=1 Tax=Rhodamnia argentea TaxID=178133 RepID=A0ABM3HHD1_9MYRT|nr:nodulin-related protein 1-like [Rhodamnia argentea]